jgi:hypothetical protein
LAPLVRALAAHSVQYVLIGLAGANFLRARCRCPQY